MSSERATGGEASPPRPRYTPALSLVPRRGPERYRKDIDGLRAIAVLGVVAFHADAQLVPGGFAGVDVFFVISGYLLTGLILEGLEDGSFRFTDFYARRIKRIFPAYIAVSLATLALSSWLLIPNDFLFYTSSLAASWAFVSNVFFSMMSWGYFGQRMEEFPLLHTWSLSVEEQFYFLYPLALVALYRAWPRRLALVLALAGAGLAMLSEMKTGELSAYFLITSRAHELIAGALTYLALRRFAPAPGRLSSSLALLGLCLVLGAFVLIHKDMPFPGLNSLFPCLGAALLIYGCAADNRVSAALRMRPLVALGLVSYSLYLWHWPIFAFLKYRHVAMTLPVCLAALALALLLAGLTWKFIERPSRRDPALGFRSTFLRLYAAPASLFIGVGLVSYATEGMPQRFSGELRELISSYSYERDLARSCSVRAEDVEPVTLEYLAAHCAFGAAGADKARLLLMGDSHAHHMKPFLEQLARDAELKGVYHVQGGCLPNELGGSDSCQQRNAGLLRLASHFDYVVLAGFWASEPGRPLEQELTRAVDAIVAAGARPVIFKDVPFHEPDLSRCILHRARGWVDARTNCHIPAATAAASQARYDAIVERMQARHPQAIVIDPKRVLCDREECITHTAGIALYKDSNHLNLRAAQLLGEWYLARVGNPFRGDANR
ncbi:acyltransferase family protein [Noviherbaspirillum sp.]|uniref:acyltransferase family protein n=1 Tax=Noviherbaspirillum sp. TaxID=1926288 RepID=UPI002D296366|nr:acyltransferase family protein [Noviherbaspirillum sp.]HZW23699.1 acyltransferase family protein [Noviherbaspirillum sp.]